MGNDGSRSSRGTSFRRSRRNSKNGSGQNYIAEDEVDRNNQELTTPKPPRRMEKIRRSLSFRRIKKKSDKNAQTQKSKTDTNIQSSASQSQQPSTATTANNIANLNNTNQSSNQTIQSVNNTNTLSNPNSSSDAPSRPALWIEDEKRVKAGNCSFQVKYLGFQEVADSRGMHICELAIEKMLAEKDKKKPIKAILYVTGDSLRVVDESNKTLLVDQTIEKVSFCAPDRHHESGFAYICRDGTARRWLCHGFMAIKDTLKNSGSGVGSSGGERLSHAVGCAFSVCLEKKQKRERENVSMEVGPNHSFTRFGSFRQASLTERFEDPQMVIPAAEPVPIKQVDNPHAIERPKANPEAFNRQNSLRASGILQMPFKRNNAAYSSLKPGELPSFQQQKLASGFGSSQPNTPLQPVTKTSLLMQQHQEKHQQQQAQNLATTPVLTPTHVNSVAKSDTLNKINTINELPEENELSKSLINNSSNNKTELETSILAEKLNLHLNVSNETKQAEPATTNSHIPIEWTQAAPNQQQFFQMSSVFTTPQSIPVTPQVVPNTATTTQTPPPLPPMPTQYITTTPMLFQANPAIASNQAIYYQQPTYQTAPNGQIIQMMPVHLPLQQVMSLPTTVHPTVLTNSIYATPMPSGTSALASPTSAMTSSSVLHSASSNSNPNETFEQKWARIQAQKKTNPFAEDIAKKFEIKL